jgi:hypothetical protein
MDPESVLAALFERPADPHRARQLVNGLPIVGVSLLSRLEALELAERDARGEVNDNIAIGDGRCCSVCFEPYIDTPEVILSMGDNDLAVISLPCRHLFHRRCLRPWFERCAKLPIRFKRHAEFTLLAAQHVRIAALTLIRIA